MKKILLHPQLTLFSPENGEIWENRLCRHACWKISASAGGGLSGVSRVRGHGSEDPIGASGNFFSFLVVVVTTVTKMA